MCLIVFSYRRHPGYQLILAANRDEFYQRPTQALSFWPDHPDILAGLDLQGGGTWLGVTRSGRIAAITNYRHIPSIRPHTPSRGMLVKDFLAGDTPPVEYLARVKSKGSRYNGFNLIVGDREALCYYSNHGGDIHRLKPGLYGLSNHLLNSPWPKVEKAKKKFQGWLNHSPGLNREALFGLLQDTGRPPDEALPDTGIGLAWERILSPMFITSDTYGTRSSALILWRDNGEITFSEASHQGPTGSGGDPNTAIRTCRLQLP